MPNSNYVGTHNDLFAKAVIFGVFAAGFLLFTFLFKSFWVHLYWQSLGTLGRAEIVGMTDAQVSMNGDDRDQDVSLLFRGVERITHSVDPSALGGYQVGDVVDIYYAPNSPEIFVLSYSPRLFYFILNIIFLSGGLLLILGAIIYLKKTVSEYRYYVYLLEHGTLGKAKVLLIEDNNHKSQAYGHYKRVELLYLDFSATIKSVNPYWVYGVSQGDEIEIRYNPQKTTDFVLEPGPDEGENPKRA